MALSEKQKGALKHEDRLGEGAKKRKSLAGKEKIPVVMKEFSKGTLHSGSGAKVKSKAQALAIGYSEARKSGAKLPRKK
jgi:hypothetical protein